MSSSSFLCHAAKNEEKPRTTPAAAVADASCSAGAYLGETENQL
jgi:hypothetical protein